MSVGDVRAAQGRGLGGVESNYSFARQMVPTASGFDGMLNDADSLRAFERTKRMLDIAGVVFLIPLAVPLAAFAALAVFLTSGRPVLFMQQRVGRFGRPFRMIKLRTMAMSTEGMTSATAVGDRRVTGLGRVLRRYRIDELPQFINVLKGDMSLIGPRPEQPSLAENYRTSLPHYDDRHLVRPGITGWAQVNYGYAATLEETREKLRYDREYIQRASLALDALIVAKTMSTLFHGKGVR